MSSNTVRVVVAIAGIVGFGLLMALRWQFSSVGMRSLMATLAFGWGVASLMWFMRSGR